tara:strand:- start:292 stop:1041 length:750 start_codon:yes stop_codon:yes gene_type:complete
MRSRDGFNQKVEEEINNIILAIIGNKEKKIDKEGSVGDAEGLDDILKNSKKNIEKFEEFVPKESDFLFIREKDESEEKIQLRYGVKEEGLNYSVDVSYVDDGLTEETEIKVSVRDEVEEEISKYSVKVSKGLSEEEKGYSIFIKYEGKGKSVGVEYSIPISLYLELREEALQDFTNAVDKSLEILPPSIMGGVLGFTYLGENYMARRSDLTGGKAYMVDVHEAIHTPDEYETRVLVSWMLSRTVSVYKR